MEPAPNAIPVGCPPTRTVATTRGLAAVATDTTTRAIRTTAALRTSLLPRPAGEQRERLVTPRDGRARVLEAVQQRQVREELRLAVDRPPDPLEIGELPLRPLPERRP